MLKIAQKTDHALLLMRHLAEGFAADKPVSLEEVARAGGISQGYLEEVARLLRTAGLIAGRRGAGGGYVLTKDPADMTVADVITATEGKSWMLQCLGEAPKETRASANDAVWRRIQGQVMTTLHGMTLASLVEARSDAQ